MKRIWLLFRDFALGLPLAAGAVAAFGVGRLTHQFPAAAASPGLLMPFLSPVLALSLEAGALIALSVALLTAVTRSARTTSRIARARATLWLFAACAAVLALAELVPRGTERPGAFANQLIQSARGSCGAGGKVPVPLLGLNVSCAPPPRIEGPMPGAPKLQLAMSELTFSDDLRQVEISGLEASLASSLRVRLRATQARVVGLAPWTRSPRLSAPGRWAVLTALAFALWASAVLLVPLQSAQPVSDANPSPRRGRPLAYLLFAAPGAAAAATIIALDQAQAMPTTYAAAGLAGVAVLALVGRLALRARQLPVLSRIFE